MRFFILMILIFSSAGVFALEDFDRQQIQQRIKPVGTVDVEEETGQEAKPAVVQAQTAEKEVPGKATYTQYCSVCHQAGVAGAPKFRNEEDWKPRLTKGIDALVASAIKGINAMPAKGTCQQCSEKDIKEAVEYMLPEKS